jgi:hypothetical protein
MLFVYFTGSGGVRNTSRLYTFISLCVLYAVPLFWLWGARRPILIRALLAAAAVISMFGGVILFLVELSAIPQPVYSNFLNELDAKMFQNYWDRLPAGAKIFDPSPPRAPVVFGRPTDSSLTWFETKPGWNQLADAPDPYAIHAAGFDYMYFGNRYWGDMKNKYRQLLNGPCVVVLQDYQNSMGQFRRLLDIRGCQ